MSIIRSVRVAPAFVALAFAAAACGGSSSGGGATVTPKAGGAAASVTTKSGTLGTHLTDSSGRTLYMFGKDTGSSSSCSGACSTEWPPLKTSGPATATGGAQSSMLGTTKRSDGATQVTYAGHPVYTFLEDRSPGQTKGEGLNAFGGVWTAVAADGSSIAPSQTKPTPASSSSSGGYVYPSY